MKKCYRFFGGLLDTQVKWLNKMAHNGFRLIKAGNLSYEFVECQPDQYQYCIEFVAHKSYKNEKEYRSFLEDMGYTVFYKNVNLNYSICKVRWRPYGYGTGQISTNPGTYNKELFIVEKKNDGRPFELHTTNADIAVYYKQIRNSWLTSTILFVGLSVWQYISSRTFSKEVIIFGIIGILLLIPVLCYQKEIIRYSIAAKTEE
ncbi:MAG: hypothetical protein K0S47_2499 [Herbinix sp.]|jgi:hypothetical protein|nr:hypothetical protein [Herbinix sp.]